MRFFLILLFFISLISNAAINGTAVTVEGTTPCNNGSIERTVAGTMTTTCGAGWSVGALGASTILFEENFDDQTDWATSSRTTLTIPTGWDAGRTDEEWHPADGDIGTQPSMMINGNNPDQVFGGTGKAWITYSESFDAIDDNGFTSDGILSKDITPSNEVYARFNIKFQTGFASDSERGQIKIFRVQSWEGVDSRYNYFSNGYSAPIYIYDWSQNDFGVRSFHAFRCDPQSGDYFCTAPSILNPPSQINNGDMTLNYTSLIAPLNPQIPDLVNGGFIPQSGTVWHNQVLGDVWHEMEFYYKLNSAPGVQDGVFKHWIDGELIVNMTEVPWIGTSGSMNAKWNVVSIGGNDRYHFDLVGDPVDRERWYAIDNILVKNALPVELQ